jgi:hypothetical protein
MSWFQVSGGVLRFRGRITREPCDGWASSREGAAVIESAARDIKFSLLGRTRAARRRISRELRAAVVTDSVRAALAAEPTRYFKSWTDLAYARSLPRLTINLHRLVVIPRTMILARALPSLTASLNACPTFTDIDESFKKHFCHHVLCEMEKAISRAEPSARRPIPTRESWVCVALDRSFVWIDPQWVGSEWLGHVMLFEMPPKGLDRAGRRELTAAIEQLTGDLPSMSRHQRSGLLRTATADLRA